MSGTRNYKDYRKDELLKELYELHLKYEHLEVSYKKDISEPKLAEEAIYRSEEKYRLLAENISDVIWIIDTETMKFLYISPSVERLRGHTAEEIMSLPVSAALLESSAEDIIDTTRKRSEDLLSGSEAPDKFYSDQIRQPCKDGSIIWTEVITRHYINPKNGRPEVLGVTRDITNRKLSEVALIESERLLKESQNVARLGSFVWNITTGLWDSSKILDDIFGIDQKYFRSFEGWGNIVHPHWRNTMINYVTDEVLGKRQRFDKEYQIIRQTDKQERWVHGLAELELNDDSQPYKLIGTITDITDRKLAEVKLEEKSEALQKELDAKKKAEIVIKKSHKELEISKLATLKLLEEIKLEMNQRREAEKQVNKLNEELEKRVNDRTAQLEAANRELQAFAYSVSHDLRAPLRAVDGFSKFVLEDYGPKLDSEGKRLLGLIRSNTQKMDQLIIDILALSRVTRSEHRVSRIDMTRMAMSMLNEVASAEIQKKIEFIVDTLPEADADPTYLKQVWINLISNAIKFSSLKKKPKIEIRAYSENDFDVYLVKDNGVGFNPEYSDKLFTVFQRLHKSDEFEGTGVGLAIVQRVIHRHGGKVWAEGNVGKGATFYFSIPVKKNDLRQVAST